MSQMLKWMVAGAVAVAMTSVVFAEDKVAETKATAPQKSILQKIKSVFHKSDVNKDSKVTTHERKARLKEWFKEMDANKDAKLTADEFQGQRFVNIDINKDGTVTMEEYLVFFAGIKTAALADKQTGSNKLDANGDNKITPVEVIAYRKSVFNAIDTEGKGRVKPDKMKAHIDKQFKNLDADKDGFVTVEELIAIIALPAVPTTEKK